MNHRSVGTHHGVRKAYGFTLIELVLAVLVIAVSVIGTLMAFNTSIRSSADPMILQQATSIGKSYLEEILAKRFTGAVPCVPGGSRANFTTVCEYHNLTDNGARNQLDQAIAGLENYTVNVTVNTGGVSLGGLASGTEVVRVDVSVSNPSISTLTFSGYRTDYN